MYEHAHIVREEPVAVGPGDAPQTLYIVREDESDYAVLYTHVTPGADRDAWCKTCRKEDCSHCLHVLTYWASGQTIGAWR